VKRKSIREQWAYVKVTGGNNERFEGDEGGEGNASVLRAYFGHYLRVTWKVASLHHQCMKGHHGKLNLSHWFIMYPLYEVHNENVVSVRP